MAQNWWKNESKIDIGGLWGRREWKVLRKQKAKIRHQTTCASSHHSLSRGATLPPHLNPTLSFLFLSSMSIFHFPFLSQFLHIFYQQFHSLFVNLLCVFMHIYTLVLLIIKWKIKLHLWIYIYIYKLFIQIKAL